MKVLALAPAPVEAAGTRYRLVQLLPALEQRGITVTLHPFLDSESFATFYDRSKWRRTARAVVLSSLRRMSHVWDAREADVLLVLREAALFGPPLLEWSAIRLGRCPLVLDLDDATYVSYVSPTFGRLALWLKWPGKTDSLIRWARVVTCGNRLISDHVSATGTPARVIPTVVDTERFRPAARSGDDSALPVVGWIGSHSTFPFVEWLSPVLQEVARTHPFRLKVVGSGRDAFAVPGIEVENLPWSLEREVADFQSLDIGLYPLIEDAYSAGKSGLKSIQYMAVGVPFVASPVGVVAEIGANGVTHLSADSPAEWGDALRRLLSDPALRRRMGEAGRGHVLRHYTVEHAAQALAEALEEAMSAPRPRSSRPTRTEPACTSSD